VRKETGPKNRTSSSVCSVFWSHCARRPSALREYQIRSYVRIYSTRYFIRWFYWHKHTQESSPRISMAKSVYCQLYGNINDVSGVGSTSVFDSLSLQLYIFTAFLQFLQQERPECIRSSTNDFQDLLADPHKL
jgi:hypothetical protein